MGLGHLLFRLIHGKCEVHLWEKKSELGENYLVKCNKCGVEELRTYKTLRCDCKYSKNCAVARQHVQTYWRNQSGKKVNECPFYKLMEDIERMDEYGK